MQVFHENSGLLIGENIERSDATCAGGALNEHGGTDTTKTFGSVWVHGHETPMSRFSGVLLRRLGRVEQVALLAVIDLTARGMVRRWRLCRVEAMVLWVLLAGSDDLGLTWSSSWSSTCAGLVCKTASGSVAPALLDCTSRRCCWCVRRFAWSAF